MLTSEPAHYLVGHNLAAALPAVIIWLAQSQGKRSKEIALSFSVTCSNCDRRFVDIDESLIGQHARCRCGSIVDLNPVWDFKKKKASSRPKSSNRSVAPAKPVKARSTKSGESKKRRSTSAPTTKSSKPQTATNRSSNVGTKKRRPELAQPAAASATVPSPLVEENPSPAETGTTDKAERGDEVLFDSYADLDQILAAGVDRTPLEPTRVDSPFEQPEEVNKPNRRGLVGACIGALTGLLAAFVLLITRISAFGGTPLGWSGGAFYGSYTASYGSGEMTNACANLFIGLGWWILLLAVLMGIASALLLVRVAIQITAGHKTLAWSRGLLATMAVVCLFSLMGLMFVQTIHHGNLIRDLDSFSNSAPIEGLLEPAGGAETFQDVREEYETESTDFMIGVLTFAVLPLISFGGVAASLLFDEG